VFEILGCIVLIVPRKLGLPWPDLQFGYICSPGTGSSFVGLSPWLVQ
jgi:hypothetical protein